MFHEDWTNRRLAKIKSIFGADWFYDKSILELGACHGDIGIHLLKMGSKVHFTDARKSNLEEINIRLQPFLYRPKVSILNQENEYHIGKYDLVIHAGVLYHIKNWKQDLACALSHAPITILETSVLPEPIRKEIISDAVDSFYGPYCKGSITKFTAASVEAELNRLGCKFIRFYDKELNSSGWSLNDVMYHNIYDWTYDNIKMSTKYNIYDYRAFWLILS